MQIKNNSILKISQNNSLAKAVRTHCLFSFFLVFFVWIQATVYAGFQPGDNTGKKNSGFNVHPDSKKNSNSDFPSSTFPFPSDQESTDESQLTEDFWESLLLTGEPLDCRYDFSLFKSSNIRIVQLAQMYQNRPGVALFILYHSWKSFLH
jgi:hypothetical protein